MDVLVHRLEAEIRDRVGEGRDSMRDLMRKLDDIRLSIPRQDALRLEVLIERLYLGSANAGNGRR